MKARKIGDGNEGRGRGRWDFKRDRLAGFDELSAIIVEASWTSGVKVEDLSLHRIQIEEAHGGPAFEPSADLPGVEIEGRAFLPDLGQVGVAVNDQVPGLALGRPCLRAFRL